MISLNDERQKNHFHHRHRHRCGQDSVHRTALASPPSNWCSGSGHETILFRGVGDVKLLQSLQPGELSDAEMNPFYFKEPIAPLIAAEKHRRHDRLSEVISRIKHVENQCDCLLIEGSGGLLVPLGKGFTVADLIAKLNCQALWSPKSPGNN